MKTYLEQLEQLEQLERLPENHFCFEPVTGTPEVPISSRKPWLRLSVITLAANDAQLVGGTLAEVLEGEVVFAVVRNGSIQILANGHGGWQRKNSYIFTFLFLILTGIMVNRRYEKRKWWNFRIALFCRQNYIKSTK